jgi:hypothetical protein
MSSLRNGWLARRIASIGRIVAGRVAIVAGLSAVACAAPPLVDQDVSFLVPLDQARTFLPAAGLAGGSPVVARALFDHLRPLTVTDEPDALYAALATVAVRLDACFKEGTQEQACRPQVRLVLQAVFDSPSGPTTRDAAVHVFFSVSEDEVKNVVRQLSLLRTMEGVKVGEGLTGTHPGFSKAAWVDAARKLIAPLLRPDHLVRATEMTVHASNEAWIFSGVNIDSGTMTDIVLPTLSPATEGHVTSTGGRDALIITLDPSPVAEPTLPTLLKSSDRQQASATMMSEAVGALQRLENPQTHNPGTVDCASCHVAATARYFLNKEAPSVPVDSPVTVSDVYADSRAQRALGYFFQRPAISPRVQRETMAVRADFTHRLEQ